MNVSAIAFTEQGCALARRLCDALAEGEHTVSLSMPERYAPDFGAEAYRSFEDWTREAWEASDALLFVSAAGIAVRAIAPYVKDKFVDPAVVSIDERGGFAVPLLSGHVGGANDFAREVAASCGAQVAISTATDVNGLFAVDEWARKQGLAILDRTAAKDVSAALLAEQPVGFASDIPYTGALPAGLIEAGDSIPAVGICVTADTDKRPFANTLRLMPRHVTVGLGCKRGTPADAIERSIAEALKLAQIPEAAVGGIASIDVKADEEGIARVAAEHGWCAQFFTADELAAVPGEFASSEFVAKTVGVDNVCERSACAGAGEGAQLLLGRQAHDGVTVALASSLGGFTISFDEE